MYDNSNLSDILKNLMESLVDRLISQLDTLIPFLEMSRQDVFDVLNNNRTVWFTNNPEVLPDVYHIYRKQINHSAFLLGYSYFEHFLADLIRTILEKRHSMLPPDNKIAYSEIIKSTDINQIIQKMIRKEVLKLFLRGSMRDIIKELRKKYQFTIEKNDRCDLYRASLIRNCIIHNSSKADEYLGQFEGFKEHSDFEISASDVHEYGIKIRHIARSMYREAEEKHKITGSQKR